MAFLPTDMFRQPGIRDDWHQQWGGTPQASGPGGGDVPFIAGAQPPPMPDWSQYRGQNQLGSPPGVDGNRGGFSQFRMDPNNEYRPMTPPAQPAPQPSGGGFTPLSQLGRGLGRLGGALHLPGFGGGNKPAVPPQTAPGGWNGQTEMLDPKYGGGPAPGNRIMADGSSWMIGIDQAHSRQLTPPGTFDPKTQRPVSAPGGAPGGGGMVLLRAPNGQTRQVPGDQVAHYLARGATRG